jgi:hypothetical protein
MVKHIPLGIYNGVNTIQGKVIHSDDKNRSRLTCFWRYVHNARQTTQTAHHFSNSGIMDR